jgi:two-component system response regulator PilR (NtrC family)
MLRREGYDVQVARDGQEALKRIQADQYDLVVTDIRMKPVDGIEVLRGAKAAQPETVVILISAFATVETAVVAMKEGAYDYIPKPFKIDDLKSVIRRALDHRTPEAEKKVLDEKVREGCHFGSLVGLSGTMRSVYDLVRRAAQTSTNILITGESGTGKELVARAIHENSPRHANRFVAINCGGMPENLIESELFGHKKGAFTGAAADKPGLFEVADKGTIFLDELAELTLPMQVKLLRVVQDKVYRPVGGTKEHQLDVRFIAATNKNLEQEVMGGKFREDLYYRLNVINIHMPPLRDRREDIPLLAQFFLDKFTRIMEKNVRKLSAYALDILSQYHFPGNVRELENIIERSVALEQTNIVLPESLALASFKQAPNWAPPPTRPVTVPVTIPNNRYVPLSLPSEVSRPPFESLGLPPGGLDAALAEMEKSILIQALWSARGQRQTTTELLRTNVRGLRYRLAKHGLQGLTLSQIEERRRKIELEPLPEGPLRPDWPENGLDIEQALETAERHFIQQALQQADGSKTRAAELLGITFRSFRYRLAKTEPGL